MAKKSLVALVKGTDIQENVTKVFDLMGGGRKRNQKRIQLLY